MAPVSLFWVKPQHCTDIVSVVFPFVLLCIDHICILPSHFQDIHYISILRIMLPSRSFSYRWEADFWHWQDKVLTKTCCPK